jgi:putative nucleotidyltransferase with HDIG domain
MPALPVRARLFIVGEVMAGLVVVAIALAQWSWSGAGIFVLLLGLSVATGAMKVVLPKVQGNLSVCYIFMMWGIVRMSLGETLLLGWASTLVQSYWHCKKKPTSIQLLFNLCVVTLSIGVGSLAFKAGLVREFLPNQLQRIFLAALAYFVVNTVSVSAVIALTERISAWNVWRTSYLWSFPHYALSASLVAAVEYLHSLIGPEVAPVILPAIYLVYRTFVMHVASLSRELERTEQEKRHAEETASLHLRTIRALALAIEAKDQTTGEHIHRVQTYAMELAKDFGLKPEEMNALHAAAILHDVGKLAVPEHIISKPAKLTPDEFAKMKTHTIVGAEIIASINFPFAVTPLVRGHHEKWDGSGYPDGLQGEEIPMGARILSAVDCLDALASDRQYRKAMPLDKAMSIVVAESGKSFDPRVVEALRERCYELEKLAQSTLQQDLMKLSTGAQVDRGAAPDAGYAAGSDIARASCAMASEEAAREMSILNSINSQIAKLGSVETGLPAVAAQLHELIPFDCFALYRRRGENLECVFAKGEAESLLLGLSIESGAGVSGWTLMNRMPLMNGNAATDFGAAGRVPSGLTLSSSLSICLESEFGPIGVVTLYSRQRDAFQTSHLRALLAISSRLAYQIYLGTSGSVLGSQDASPRDDAAAGIQLGQLSEILQRSLDACITGKLSRAKIETLQ